MNKIILISFICFFCYNCSEAREYFPSWKHTTDVSYFVCDNMKNIELNVFKEAFQKWQKHLKIKFKFGGYKNRISQNGIFICIDSEWKNAKYSDMAAITHLFYGDYSEKMKKAHILFNGKYLKWTADLEFKATLLHEIGHALGLTKHSSNGNSIMHESVGDNKATLHKEDIVNIKKLYQI